MGTFKKLFKNSRILILLIFLIISIIAISPAPWNDGLVIKSVVKNSTAANAGISNPLPTTMPVSLERIETIDGMPIMTEQEFNELLSGFDVNRTFILETNKDKYKLTTEPLIEVVILNETENVTYIVEVYNETTNTTKNVTKTELRNKTIERVIGVQDIGLRVAPAPQDNIRKGLDLSGGTRVLLKPESQVSDEDMDLLLNSMKERLNVFGLSDVIIRTTQDLSGNVFILVEIAGANIDQVKELLAQQGKFEAKIGDKTVFRGGQDITYVCRTGECSGLDRNRGCSQDRNTGTYFCGFSFTISLTPEAADRHAEVTRDLSVDYSSGEGYLNESLDLYLDNELRDTLRIAEGLKGRSTKQILIQGSGSGPTQKDAVRDALDSMKSLQTILITGSLPVELEIVKTDSVTPVLGKEFLDNIMLVALVAILAVALVVYVRYRKLAVAIPVIITLLSELIILLGIAALIKWNLDLVAIAGIIIAIGTGVDAQIIIADEILRKEVQAFSSWKAKIKNAFFIIMASYFTLVVAMLPLWSAGAGLLKGFALTTIIGVSVGVFITRPAFAKMAETFLKRE